MKNMVKKRCLFLIYNLIFIMLLSGGVSLFGAFVQAAPAAVITSVSPSSGKVGSTISIYGTGFSATANYVYFSNCSGCHPYYLGAPISSSNGETKISFVLPSTMKRCSSSNSTLMTDVAIPTGAFTVYVSNGYGSSNSLNFQITADSAVPIINSISPSSIKVGEVVTISGTGFTATNNTIYFSNCSSGTEGCYPYYMQNVQSSNSGVSISFALPSKMKRSSTGATADVSDVATPTGTFSVSVSNANGTSKTVSLDITAKSAPVPDEQPFSTTTLMKPINDNNVYIVNDNKKILIPSWDAFVNNGFKATDIKVVSSGEISAKPAASLLKGDDDDKVYALKNNRLFWIPSAAVFTNAGYNWNDIVSLPAKQRDMYQQTFLVKALNDTKVYKLENNMKRWIINAQKFDSLGYGWNQITEINPAELAGYQTGGDMN